MAKTDLDLELACNEEPLDSICLSNTDGFGKGRGSELEIVIHENDKTACVILSKDKIKTLTLELFKVYGDEAMAVLYSNGKQDV